MDIFSTPLVFILMSAMIQVESRGDCEAVGDDGRSFGPLQIQQIYLDDIERFAGIKFTIEQIKEECFARIACWHYLKHYAQKIHELENRQVTLEDLARTHNSGPMGYLKESTDIYWIKVKKELETI